MISRGATEQSLAVAGGKPVRETFLPYGRQWLDEADIEAVVQVLRSAWLTTGPKVDEFEREFARTTGARQAVAVNSGTAALHAAVFASGIAPGDEVILPPLTFAASANAVLYRGGRPVFADVEPDTLLLDPAQVERNITPRTKAVIAVDYAGQPCDYTALEALARRHDLRLIADACHSLGGSYQGRRVGSLAELNTFSFHPVKTITTGEGGLVTAADANLGEAMRTFRNHGITTDFRQRAEAGGWLYEMVSLGFNYRLSDIACALGLSQLPKLSALLARRREIAARYNEAFSANPAVTPLTQRPDRESAWHLYVVRLSTERLRVPRALIFAALRAENIGVNVHYLPVYRHPYYQQLGYNYSLCPVAEAAYEEMLTLPLFPAMTDQDADDVVMALEKVCTAYAK
jgi:perosamine synthetase